MVRRKDNSMDYNFVSAEWIGVDSQGPKRPETINSDPQYAFFLLKKPRYPKLFQLSPMDVYQGSSVSTVISNQ